MNKYEKLTTIPRSHVLMTYQNNLEFLEDYYTKIFSEYDQEVPQSHTTDQPTAPSVRATEQTRHQEVNLSKVIRLQRSGIDTIKYHT